MHTPATSLRPSPKRSARQTSAAPPPVRLLGLRILDRRRPRVGVLGASIVVVLTAAIVGAQPTETPDDAELLAEIEALVGNVYDQKMARQFGTLELPRAEVQARLDTFGRWLDATRRGAFPKSTRLPEGLVETYEKTRAALSEAGQAPSAEQLDAVLLFLEEHTDALQKASGLEIELPM